MKFFPISTLLALTVTTALPVTAQTTSNATRQPDATPNATAAAITASTTTSTGPKVHTSKARDVTDCSKTVNGGG